MCVYVCVCLHPCADIDSQLLETDDKTFFSLVPSLSLSLSISVLPILLYFMFFLFFSFIASRSTQKPGSALSDGFGGRSSSTDSGCLSWLHNF